MKLVEKNEVINGLTDLGIEVIQVTFNDGGGSVSAAEHELKHRKKTALERIEEQKKSQARNTGASVREELFFVCENIEETEKGRIFDIQLRVFG